MPLSSPPLLSPTPANYSVPTTSPQKNNDPKLTTSSSRKRWVCFSVTPLDLFWILSDYFQHQFQFPFSENATGSSSINFVATAHFDCSSPEQVKTSPVLSVLMEMKVAPTEEKNNSPGHVSQGISVLYALSMWALEMVLSGRATGIQRGFCLPYERDVCIA